MKSALNTQCLKITELLMTRPIYQYFVDPINPKIQKLPDYEKIVKPPWMDLTTIKKKLKEDRYQTCQDWYNDVLIIFKNAKLYNPEGNIFHNIATYCETDFIKSYSAMSCSDIDAWFGLLQKAGKKYQKILAESPVKQGEDPLIGSILRESDTQIPPSPQVIPDMVEWLNQKMDAEPIRHDAIRILKETQPNFSVAGERAVIDADKLSDRALTALSLYIGAHS